jgi:hypothetical protein
MILAKVLLENRNHAPHKRLSFRQPVRVVIQSGKIIKDAGNVRMIGATYQVI